MADPTKASPPASPQPARIRPPSGTRDLYPDDMRRRRYVMDAWRRVGIRHGFDEVDGPTFETTELYTVKSGEGIVGELFQAFSGKDPEQRAALQRGEPAPFAIRPEFTPTLARMYAAQARSLPRPCKWFMAGPFFRAERPQRGRLREFLQWNVDILGAPGEEDHAARQEAEAIAVCVDLLRELGLTSKDVRIKLGARQMVTRRLADINYPAESTDQVIALLDARPKIGAEKYRERARELGLPDAMIAQFDPERREVVRLDLSPDQIAKMGGDAASYEQQFTTEGTLFRELDVLGLREWCEFDNMVIRGLAYYTGTVFEAIADGERAVAGGGRYDGLVELFGGPATPAVGFAMGDVVLSLLLEDKGLMPADAALLERTGGRPDAFVIPGGDATDTDVRRAVAMLRSAGLHARTTTKTTRNIGKLLKDAASSHARFAVILESATEATIKDMARGEQDPARTLVANLAHTIASR